MTKFDIKRMEQNIKKFYTNISPKESTHGTAICEDQARLLHEYQQIKEKNEQLKQELYDCLFQAKSF